VTNVWRLPDLHYYSSIVPNWPWISALCGADLHEL